MYIYFALRSNPYHHPPQHTQAKKIKEIGYSYRVQSTPDGAILAILSIARKHTIWRYYFEARRNV